MSTPDLHCADSAPRRRATRARRLNAIDFVEPHEDRRGVTVHFLTDAPADLGPENVRIDTEPGAVPLRAAHVRLCREDDARLRNCVRITFDRPGDGSTYTLSLADAGLDPHGASAEFSFAAGCPSDLDCLQPDVCPPETFPEPAISYLAKDYASFRQLILDRLALIMPGWTERHVPDLELTLVELLAYVGDYLSYYQDAVATEAYLGTARRRISLRRHARLVDYRMHEGCNARAWVVVSVAGDLELEAGDYRFLTASAEAGLRPDDEVFEPVSARPLRLRRARNEIELWTWGEDECCLAAGATRVTLRDGRDPDRLQIAPGDVLLFEEVLGPRTGSPDDADPTHRQAVRLTRVTPGYDEVLEQPVVEVEWAAEDALAFPLCLSAVGPDCAPLRGISVARGNVVLVDHGRSIDWCQEPPEEVPVPPAPLGDPVCDPCGPPSMRRALEAILAAGKEPTAAELELFEEAGGPDMRTLDELAAFLETRGRFPVPFTASLRQTPLTHRVPFPSDATVAAGQARRLEALEDLVRRSVLRLLRKAERGEELTVAELMGLSVTFGERALRNADLVGRRDRASRPPNGNDVTVRALRHLLHAWPELLRRKLERLETLARRARAGSVLGEDERAEIAEAWGAQWAAELDPSNQQFDGPACAALEQDPREALAALSLAGPGGTSWEVRPDLLSSDPTDRGVVVEVDDEGIAHLRFGDGDCGRAVDPGTTLRASYRVGNGTAGNVGAEVISRIELCKTHQTEITRVRNPLPACGGVEPESLDEVRLFAPLAFKRTALRAVTASDYAALAETVPGVQRAAATLRWTGSWYEADVALDPLGTETTSPQLARAVAERLFPARRIGHDVRVAGAEYVALDLALRICVLPHHLRGEVEQGVLDALGARTLPSGRKGFFHPDNLTFGGEVAVSAIVATVQAIDGVQSVDVVRFERLGEGDHGELARGTLRLGPFEIARLDNDARRPAHGRLTLDLRGGR